MSQDGYAQKAGHYLKTLCSIPSGRSTGSAGNRAATDFYEGVAGQWDYTLDTTPFDCLDFSSGGSSLTCNGRYLKVHVSPFSVGCDITAELVTVSTVEELEECTCEGKILLVQGAVCAEHLMPRNHPFYNPDHHKKIYALLDEKRPAAVITATSRNPAMMGAMYPYPLIEDGDFDIPSVYCNKSTGEKIAALAGDEFRLAVRAERIHTTACNVIARKVPDAGQKVVICAHIDARPGTPGALDNASGTVVLLLLAEMLGQYKGKTGIELVAINGEDHYSACGEIDYLNRYGNELDRVLLAINIDGIGYTKGKTSFSFYGCPGHISRKARAAFKAYGGLSEGGQWYAGDHMVFVQGGKPAIALTSERAVELTRKITHTPKDTPDLVDPEKLVEAARAIEDLIKRM